MKTIASALLLRAAAMPIAAQMRSGATTARWKFDASAGVLGSAYAQIPCHS